MMKATAATAASAILYGMFTIWAWKTTISSILVSRSTPTSSVITNSRRQVGSIFVRGFQTIPLRVSTSRITMESSSNENQSSADAADAATTASGMKRKLHMLDSSSTLPAEGVANTETPATETSQAKADTSSQSQHRNPNPSTANNNKSDVPLYLAEGLFAVDKPLNWTSQDVVSYVRRIIERDSRQRGANPAKIGRKNKSRQIKVGHGGTLDPLASGVLVVGVGKGTKDLSKYLHGSKAYRATGRLGTETTTLDLDPKGNITSTKPYDHVTFDQIESILPKFQGKIQQIPPVFSAKRQGGRKAYEIARMEGVESVKMEPKEVEIHRLALLKASEPQQDEKVQSPTVDDEKHSSTTSTNPKLDPISSSLPDFTIEMECGGGTFVRSLIRDIAYECDTVATTALLQRTKQGPFLLADCIAKDSLSADSIYDEIRKWNTKLVDSTEDDS